MDNASQTFCLIPLGKGQASTVADVERDASADSRTRLGGNYHELGEKESLSLEGEQELLSLEGEQELLSLQGEQELLSFQGDRVTRAKSDETAIKLVTVRQPSRPPTLVMTNESSRRVSINGLSAHLLSALHAGDLLTIENECFQVVLLNRPYVGPPREGLHIGVNCGYCRVPISDEPDMRVYVCPQCRLPTHDQSEEVPAERRLECARLASQCGHCQADVQDMEGFSHVPAV